jgi:H+/Cl- antiporter ClcA
MGFVATFAGASNAPLASIVVGIELFGASSAPYLAIACIVAYLSSGNTGMYPGQMVDQPKHERAS